MLPKLKCNFIVFFTFISIISIFEENSFFYLFRSEMDKQKNTLLDAYVRKFIALGKLHVIAAKQTESETPRSEGADLSLELRCVGAPPSHGLGPEFDSIYTEVGKFVEYNDQKV